MQIRVLTITVCLLFTVFAATVSADQADIAYGTAAQQKLDVFAAVGGQAGEKHPVVIWVHGGGWRHGDKDHRAGKDLCKTWANAGIVMVNLNYRLTPDVMHPAHVEDVAAGIAWVHKHIAEYGGAPQRVYLLGHSAGGHLVALVATNPKYLKAHNLVPNQALAGVMPIDGASYDLTATRAPLVRGMIHDAFGDDPQTLTDASPLLQAKRHRDTCPPFVIAVVKQRPEAWRESTALSDALAKSKVIAMDHPGSNPLKAHGAIALDLLNVKNDLTRQLLAFVKDGPK